MVNNIDIDFGKIRPYDGDKRKGFEELVCQLARRENRPLQRVEGSGGDGGVEAYYIFKNGQKHGYQAKYFLSTKDISWSQIDKSVETSLKQHPDLAKYTIAIACDLTGRSGKKGGGKHGWEHWETHKAKWKKAAYDKGMAVEFILWSKSDLVDLLSSTPENHGLILWWFDLTLFNEEWFRRIFDRTREDLGERFQPEDHVEVEIAEVFHGLARSSEYLNYLKEWFRSLPRTDKLGKVFNELKSSLDVPSLQNLGKLCAEIRGIERTIHAYGAQPFPLEDWQGAIKPALKEVSLIQEWLYDQKFDLKNKKVMHYVNHSLHYISEIVSHIDCAPIHLDQNNPHEFRVEADLQRALVVVGEAGSGKSHLFADAVAFALKKSTPAILLLGQYFSGQDIRRELLNSLDLADHDFIEVLQALNAAGEAKKTRVIILIDALNEAQNLRFWNDQLAGFIFDILEHEWLAIGFSLRPEYEKYLIPTTVRNRSLHVLCSGIRTQDEKEKAAKQYFEKRGITRPAVPWLAPEFSNFLFLKMCCDVLKEKRLKEFPRGLRGSLQVLEFYVSSIYMKIKTRFPESDIPNSAIQNSLKRFAISMADKKNDFISSKLALEICDNEFGCRGPNSVITWISVLASEGVVRKEHIFIGDKDDPFSKAEEVYRIGYHRFSDHLIVQALLRDIEDIDEAFGNGQPLGFLLDSGDFIEFSSLWSAFAVQIPEKYEGKELLDVVPNDTDSHIEHIVREAFEQSLLWRLNNAFSNRTLELFNSLPTKWGDKRIDILIRIATLVDHPWNAEFLDSNLKSLQMPERDSFWTVNINKVTDDATNPIWELIHWCLKSNLQLAETETLRLASITLIWLLTSSSRPLRDTATKALTSIFVNSPKLISGVLERFRDVDDFYVMERVCAAVLGTVTRDISQDDIEAAAYAIYESIFDCKTPHLNINLRDYARAVIEYALQNECLPESIDIEKCRPPYKSEWPLEDATEEELEKIAKDSGGEEILKSVLGCVGNFGTHTIRHRVTNFTDISLLQPRPLNTEEKEKAFKEQIKNWGYEKQKAFQEFEAAVKKKWYSFRMEILEKRNGEKEWLSGTNLHKLCDLAKQKEENFLSLLDKDEHVVFETLMAPVLMPDRISSTNRDLAIFDSNFARRWITKRSYEYGWNNKLFPDDYGLGGYSRERPRIERIGRKYQWLALMELMVRLSDNVWAIGGSPQTARLYDHPATDWFVRDIEPSLLTDPEKKVNTQNWWQKVRLKLEPIEDNNLRTWPFEIEPPYTSSWIDVLSHNGVSWLLLNGMFDVDEERENKDFSMIYTRRNIIVRVSTILVKNDADFVISKLKGGRLASSAELETLEWIDGPFLCEYPWRNTWQTDYGVYEDRAMSEFSGIRFIRPVARHEWERGLDLSLENGSSVCIPNPWIGEKLHLKPNLDSPGEFFDKSNDELTFIDPTFGSSYSSVALFEKTKFFDFLEKEGLLCLWIVAGELNSWPSGRLGDYSCRSFSSIYHWKDERWVGQRWCENVCITNNA